MREWDEKESEKTGTGRCTQRQGKGNKAQNQNPLYAFLGHAMKAVGLCLSCRTRWKILKHYIHYHCGASSREERTRCVYISHLLVVLVLAE